MLLKVKQKNPDVLFVGSHLMVAMKTIKAMKEIDFTPKMVTFSYGPTVPDFIKNLGKDAEYVVAASEWAPNLPYKDPLFGTARQFNENYFKKYGRTPTMSKPPLRRAPMPCRLPLKNWGSRLR